MRYRVGDRVKIKTWEEMKEKFGLFYDKFINTPSFFTPDMERKLIVLNTNRILTIREIVKGGRDYYLMKEQGYSWNDEMIECLAKDDKEEIEEPIDNRFEIMDL